MIQYLKRRFEKKHALRNPKDYHFLFSNCFTIFDYESNVTCI